MAKSCDIFGLFLFLSYRHQMHKQSYGWVGLTGKHMLQEQFHIHLFLPDSLIIFFNMQHDFIKCIFAVSGTLCLNKFFLCLCCGRARPIRANKPEDNRETFTINSRWGKGLLLQDSKFYSISSFYKTSEWRHAFPIPNIVVLLLKWLSQ